MSIRSDHKALMFVGAIAVLGAGVRVVRAATSSGAQSAQPALEHQMQAADSAAKAGKGRVHGRAAGDTTKRRRAGIARSTTSDSSRAQRSPADRKGYVNGRLDLDVATAAQLDSLPGVSPAMAKRIVAHRMQRGPFLNLQRLRRVSGVGPSFIARIDSLVTFSGTVVAPNAADTVVPARKRR
jgi:competence protein ComEA